MEFGADPIDGWHSPRKSVSKHKNTDHKLFIGCLEPEVPVQVLI
jgi:hypothetical protein